MAKYMDMISLINGELTHKIHKFNFVFRMFLEVSLALAVFYVIAFITKTWLETRKLPPGPFPLPLIGNLHQLGNNPPYTMLEMCLKYRDVMTVKFPFGYCLFLNSAEAAREAMVTRKTDFAGRPVKEFYPMNILFEEKDIVTADYGQLFVFRSKVFKSALHLFGEETEKLEKRLNETVSLLCSRLDKCVGQKLNIMTIIRSEIIKHMWEWISSERLAHDDPKVQTIINFINSISFLGRQGSIFQLIPLLRFLPSQFKRNLDNVLKTREELFVGLLEHHKKTFKSDNLRDITDGMLAAYFKEEKEGKKQVGTSDDIVFLMMDVIVGGVDTSVSALNWCLLHLIVMEDIQTKIQEELDTSYEKGKVLTFEEVKKFDYLHAFVCEVMRSTPLSPLIGLHRTMRETFVMGYNIPKNMLVFLNQHSVNHDPITWKNPSVFKPGRFLDENGKFVGWSGIPSFMPFGLGRRACPGRDLGKFEVVMMLAHILSRYRIKLAENTIAPKLDDPVVQMTSRPKEYMVTISKRN